MAGTREDTNLFEVFEGRVVEGEFNVNDLGSCQYSTVNNFLDFVAAEKASTESVQSFLQRLSIDVSFDAVQSAAVAQKQLRDELQAEKKAARAENEDWLVEFTSERLERLKAVRSYVDLFTYCRESSMDLWSAARTLGEIVFSGLSIRCHATHDIYRLNMNQAVQNEGLRTGIICALFIDQGLVSKKAVFAGFDT